MTEHPGPQSDAKRHRSIRRESSTRPVPTPLLAELATLAVPSPLMCFRSRHLPVRRASPPLCTPFFTQSPALGSVSHARPAHSCPLLPTPLQRMSSLHRLGHLYRCSPLLSCIACSQQTRLPLRCWLVGIAATPYCQQARSLAATLWLHPHALSLSPVMISRQSHRHPAANARRIFRIGSNWAIQGRRRLAGIRREPRRLPRSPARQTQARSSSSQTLSSHLGRPRVCPPGRLVVLSRPGPATNTPEFQQINSRRPRCRWNGLDGKGSVGMPLVSACPAHSAHSAD
ncbi:uncharacterized protein BJ171DRAFT_209044 [Polychytrium aggregatum]|uniref:uncharacterized protein n=1 Tax=Polychytrium aggregatum TaxID=110093 RepID=UPI0022FDEC57|nr:uncharacterized protein BJ171DRAFT_209044 [Polychytrium aggregatum]KAI9208516.1 hypothetical protein BJ171DRAFT_209044 [Polychytrium aggregatum]